MFKNPGSKLETIAYAWFFIRIIIGVVLIMYIVSLLRNLCTMDYLIWMYLALY